MGNYLSIITIMLPIFVLAFSGFFLSKIYDISRDTLVKILVDLLLPMLVFHALCTSDIDIKMMGNLVGVTSFIVLSLFVIAMIYCRVTGMDRRVFVPTIIFMNSGYIGIPLMKIWGGLHAMNMVVIYDQVHVLYIFTLGLMTVAGGFSLHGLKEMIKAPILWAVIFGFTFRLVGIALPEPILKILSFGGDAAPPLAALAVGIAVGGTKIRFSRHLLAALLFRFVGGFLAGLAGCRIFGIEGEAMTVVLVASSLPSAVFASILPLRYGIKSDFGGVMVAVSTILGLITIPLSFILSGLV